jgi:predicted nucleic acid-binding protein
MNVVDSSGWLEYFADEPNADFFAPAIENKKELIVPAISLYEVFKRVYQQRGEDDALKAVAQMLQGQVIELDAPLALRAAKISTGFSLPMADSIILAAALAHEATLWTQDEHFKDIEGVRYIEKQKAR